MNVQTADYLIGLDKYITLNGDWKESHLLEIQYPMKFRISLSSPDDLDQNFFVDVWESEKKALKICLHHQDDNTQYPLLRVDYNGRHKNPEEIIASVPEKFHPYAGLYLDEYPGHIHYVVEGYKTLAWAIPLEVDEFPIKELTGKEDYAETLKAFFMRINIKTSVNFSTQLRTI